MENIDLPLCISFAALVFIVYFLFRSNRRSLLKTGIHALAEVISIERTVFGGGSSADAGPVMKVVLNIENQGQPNIQTTIMTTFGMGEILPEAGKKFRYYLTQRNRKNYCSLESVTTGQPITRSNFFSDGGCA